MLLRGRSKEVILEMTPADYKRFMVSPGRDYSMVVLLLAGSLMDSPKTKLRLLRQEFVYASAGIPAGPTRQQGLFCGVIL